jgi:Uri superfamily endonuclease
VLGMQQGVSIPLAGFGASDWLCRSHLFFFRCRLSRIAFARSLRAFDRRHPTVRIFGLKP